MYFFSKFIDVERFFWCIYYIFIGVVKLFVGLLIFCMEFGWNYNVIFKYIIFKYRIEFEIEFVFWFEEEKRVLLKIKI